MYHATPQTQGRMAHETVDKKTASNRSDVILSLPVYSEEYGLMEKIDVYKVKEKKLIDDEILDSFDIISIVGDINDTFDVSISADELLPENFNSAEAIWDLIRKMKEQA